MLLLELHSRKKKEQSQKNFREYVRYCRSRWKSSPHVSGYGILSMLLLESYDRKKKGGPIDFWRIYWVLPLMLGELTTCL